MIGYCATLGLNTALTRRIADALARERHDQVRTYVRIGLRIVCAAGVTAAGIVFLLVRTLPLSTCDVLRESRAALPYAAWIALQAVSLVTSDIFRGLGDLRSATIFSPMLANALALAAIAVASAIGPMEMSTVLWMVVGGWAGNVLFAIIGLMRAMKRVLPIENHGVGAIDGWELLHESLPMMASGIAAAAAGQIDVWVVGGMYGSSDDRLALYAASARLVGLVGASLIVVNSVLPPFIAQLHALDRRNQLERLLRTSATIAGAPAIVALLAMQAGAEPILELCYGPIYRNGANILRILAAGSIAAAFAGSAGMALLMSGHARPQMLVAIGFTLLTALAAWFGTLQGITTVALAVAFVVVMQRITLVLVVRRLLGIRSQIYPLTAWPHLYMAYAKRAAGGKSETEAAEPISPGADRANGA
jgi:O-antigen/teichoic acid export membrane protein